MKYDQQINCDNESCSSSSLQQKKVQASDHGVIDAKALKNLIDTKTNMVILDARNKQWDDGRRIPGGKSVPFDSSPEAVLLAAPHKDSLIVVYCGAYQCPQGRTLADRMTNEGYTHILEYAGGMHEWAYQMNYPVERS
ncbi:MAG: rhodanese-like domain-containing protein [Alphaproteobacteria bacterium]|nr:rhodanese-like domain-containing protein [Alphaproteobacteria bacterium]